MRRAFLVLAAVLTAACKDGKGITAPVATNGTLNVQIETKTCSTQGSFDISVFIDHVLVGTPTFKIGSTASYSVLAGDHTIGGFAMDGRFNWGSVTVAVPAGGQYTALFACQ
jgi:hypothetical protein